VFGVSCLAFKYLPINNYNVATIQRFEDLEVWKKSREICKYIKILTSKEQFSRDYSLKDQIKRSSGSAMDNIAEGFERDGNKEFVNFLTISKGSIGEVRSQTYRAFDYEYINQEEFEFMINETVSLSERLGKFISYLRNTEYKGVKFKKDNDKA
jgi:four helix bundle protein